MSDADEINISKLLSLALRHKPESIGIELDEHGWASVPTLLSAMEKHGHCVTLEQLKLVVANSDKQRFAFNAENTMIRANQGHSIPIELGYERQEPPKTLFHGTATRFLDSIREEGLKMGSRNHVHLSASKETAVSVGKRHGKPVVLQVAAGKMHSDGFIFFLSANGVWLTEHVPPQYLSSE